MITLENLWVGSDDSIVHSFLASIAGVMIGTQSTPQSSGADLRRTTLATGLATPPTNGGSPQGNDDGENSEAVRGEHLGRKTTIENEDKGAL